MSECQEEGKRRTLWHLSTAQGGGFSFGTERVEVGSRIPLHVHHESDELIFIHRGSALLTHGESKDAHPMNEGDSICISAGAFHEIHNVSPTEALLLTWTLSPPMAIPSFQAK